MSLLETYKTITTPMLSYFNVGTGTDCSIKELTETIAEVVGFSGKILWDISKPDGAPRKLMDSDILKPTGWRPKCELKGGLEQAYAWFLDDLEVARK
jgi:GDP-L-fucose synthase